MQPVGRLLLVGSREWRYQPRSGRSARIATSPIVLGRTISAVFEVESGTTGTLTLYGCTSGGGITFYVRGELVAETFPRSNEVHLDP